MTDDDIDTLYKKLDFESTITGKDCFYTLHKLEICKIKIASDRTGKEVTEMINNLLSKYKEVQMLIDYKSICFYFDKGIRQLAFIPVVYSGYVPMPSN